MLKSVVKIVNTITAVYVIYVCANAIYQMGQESGSKKLVENQDNDDVSTDAPKYKNIDGVLYMRAN